MRKLIISILLIYCNILIAQQNQPYDSIANFIQSYQYKSAIELINNRLDKGMETAKLYQLKGLAYRGLLKYPEAIYAFESAFLMDSSNYQIVNDLGTCYKSIGNYSKALWAFEKAGIINPTNPSIQIEIAGLLVSLEQYRRALDVYFSLYQKDTINIFLLRNIAKSYDNLEKTDSAGVYYEKAVKLYPHDFQTVFRLTNIYLKQKQYTKAIDITTNYKYFDSKNNKINRLNAYAIYLSEDYRKALDNFNQCVRNNDTSDFSFKYLGLSYFKLEQYDSARIFLEKSFIKDSLNAQTCYVLGIACKLSNFNKDGITYIAKTLDLVRPSPKFETEVLQQLAEAYNNCNLYQKGLKSLLMAYRIAPDDTLLKFRIAVQYDENIKDRKLALKYYLEFMKTRPKKGNGGRNKAALSYYDAVEKRIKQLK